MSNIIPKVDSIITEEVKGLSKLSETDLELFALIEKYAAGIEVSALRSALLASKDKSMPKDERKGAIYKLRRFLARQGKNLEKTAYNVTEAYLKSLVSGN